MEKKLNSYTADNLTSLSEMEAVRKRPGMYIGATDITGLHHLVWEIVDNAVDEAKEGYGKRIEVTIHLDNSISVEDQGRGVPCDINHKENISGFDMVYLKLHSGGKFDESNYRSAGGLHGVGGAVVNALSDWMEIHSYRDGYDNYIKYYNGKNIDKGEKLATKIKKTPLDKLSKRGTLVTFHPDPSIFADTNFDYSKISTSLDDRAGLNKGVLFILKDERTSRHEEFIYKDGLKEYFVKHSYGKSPLGEPIYIKGEYKVDDNESIHVEFIGQYYQDLQMENISSFTNGVRTSEGGSHVSGLKKALTNVFNKYANLHKLLKGKDQTLEGSDIRTGLSCILAVDVPEKLIIFEGQTKTKLGTKEALNAVDEVIENNLYYYLEEHSKDTSAIFEKILSSLQERLEANKAKENVRKLSKQDKVKLSNLSGKLTPASSKNYALNELFIVEGDSAGGSAKKCRDWQHQAILPLRGKPKNVVGESLADVYDNKELNTIIYTIGAGCDKEFKLKDMHYGKIIIMTDADDDGCHIQNLLISFFYEHMRPLVENGHLYIACPPLYRLATKNEEIYCWSDEELAQARQKIGKGYILSRYKGLGEMNADQLGQTTMSVNSRRLIQVVIDDIEECGDKVKLFMDKNFADKRREWIDNNIDFSFKQDYFEEIKSNESK